MSYRSNAIAGDELTQGTILEPPAINHPQSMGHHSGMVEERKRRGTSDINSDSTSHSQSNKASTEGIPEILDKDSSDVKMENKTSAINNNKNNTNKSGQSMNSEVPTLNNNQEQENHGKDCPYGCSCGHILSPMADIRLYGTDCSNLRLQKLPSNTPAEVQLLKLGGNRIKPMELGDLKGFPKLVELHLEGNVIFSIERWVPLCDKLRYLAMDGNRIAYLDNLTLSGVSNLLELSLARNQVEQIHGDAFLWVRKLEVLQLAGNRLSEVDVRWFKYFLNLQTLNLAENYIHTLLDGNFHYLNQLKTLDMSSNHLSVIHNKAFAGLTNLKKLYLQQNSLHVLPASPTQVFKLCDVIDLSSNHFSVLDRQEGFLNTNVTHLKLNTNKQLKLVDIESFVNLQYLRTLEMMNCPNLKYIDRRAFSGVPVMGSLYLSHNALSTLEKEIVASLPELRVIDLGNNPLYCDCSLTWAKNKAFLLSRNLTIVNTTETVCDQPNDYTGISINDPKLEAIPEVCPPRILPLFGRQYNVSLGDPFSISCKASGYPSPSIQWYLPSNHKRKMDKSTVKANSNTPEKENVRHSGPVPSDKAVIDFVDRTDMGNYSCVAQNRIGQATRFTLLHVMLSSAYLIISHVTSSSVTLTWGKTQHARNYELRYWLQEPASTNITYHTQQILAYMRAYTASHLNPSTKYKFCLSVRYKSDHIPINCTIVSTKEAGFALEGLHSSKNYVIGGAISVLICVIIVICTVGHFSRKYNKKRNRDQKMYSDSLSQLYPASVDSISDTTPIAYENRMSELFDIEEGSGGEFPTSSSGSCREEMESTSTTQT